MVEFNKAGHEVTVGLDSSQWATTPEYILAKVDNAALNVKLEINNQGAAVNLYAVAEPPNDEHVLSSRTDLLEAVKGKAGKHALFKEDGSVLLEGHKLDSVITTNQFASRTVQSVNAGKTADIPIPHADRHLLQAFPSAGEFDNVTAQVGLSFQENTKLYVLYFTTEPSKL